MTWTIAGRIRAYDPATDTASVELEGIGIIDAWLDNLRIHAAINRSFAVLGAPVTIQAPDPNRLCEAVIASIGDTVTTPTQQTGSGVQQTQIGRNNILTNNTGTGSTTVTFPIPYTAVPTFYATADGHFPLTITGLTALHFTAGVTGGPPSSYLYLSWQSAGPV